MARSFHNIALDVIVKYDRLQEHKYNSSKLFSYPGECLVIQRDLFQRGK